MKKSFKFILVIVLFFLLSSVGFSKFSAKASSSQTSAFFEDFVAKTHQRMLFVEENMVSKCYLVEGVTPSFMIYDYEHSELLYFCENGNSPWNAYNTNLFSNFGYVYLYNSGYCIINLSKIGTYSYGDIVNIEGDMEIYVKTDANLADMILEMISIPDRFDFASLFPKDKVIADVEIPTAYYFRNLNKNIGENYVQECTLIALAGILSYFDIFYDDTIIPDQYMNKEIIYNHHIENAISSPGGLKFYDYLLYEKAKETTEYKYNLPCFDRLEGKPWYYDPDVNVALVSSQLLDIIYNTWCTSPTHDENCTKCFSKNFDLVRFYNSHHPNANYKYSFEDLIAMGLPVVVKMFSEYYDIDEDNYVEYPIEYYIANKSDWNSIYNAGHAFICYGYLKVRENDEHFGTQNVTYYKGHVGSRDADGTYFYTQAIFSNRFVNGEYGGDNVTGYTFVPKNMDYHICSKNYMYTKGECSFGICPCDSKLSTKNFLQKYSNVKKVGNVDQYICKEHNTHILAESIHEHQFAYLQNSETLHTKYCTIEGCTYSVQMNHNFKSVNTYNPVYHKDMCDCGYVKHTEHTFRHTSTSDGHEIRCSKCGYCASYEGEYTEIYEYEHGYYCDECKKTIYENHKLLYEKIDENHHRRCCAICAYSEIVPHESYGNELYYTTLSDGTIVVFCPQCCYEKKQK